MNDLLLSLFVAVLVYLGWLLFWGVICLLAYSLSLVFKKNSIINAILMLNVFLIQIFNFALGIGFLVAIIYLLIHGEFLWFVLMLFFGLGLISGLIGFLNMPFLLISAYFADKVEKTNGSTDVQEAFPLDENHRVVGKLEGEATITRRLAKFFLIGYCLNLLNLFLEASSYPNYTWLDYVVMPAIWVGTSSLFFGILFGIYDLVTYHKFFYPRKKLFLIKAIKSACVLLGILTILMICIRLGSG